MSKNLNISLALMAVLTITLTRFNNAPATGTAPRNAAQLQQSPALLSRPLSAIPEAPIGEELIREPSEVPILIPPTSSPPPPLLPPTHPPSKPPSHLTPIPSPPLPSLSSPALFKYRHITDSQAASSTSWTLPSSIVGGADNVNWSHKCHATGSDYQLLDAEGPWQNRWKHRVTICDGFTKVTCMLDAKSGIAGVGKVRGAIVTKPLVWRT